MAQAMRDILRSCAESGGVDPATGRFKDPIVRLSRCGFALDMYLFLSHPPHRLPEPRLDTPTHA